MKRADNDGDSQMHLSSPESEDTDAMFPTANDPPAPPGAPTTQTLYAEQRAVYDRAELSPPHSQDRFQANGDDTMDLTDGFEATAGRSARVQDETAQYAISTEDSQRPGASWDNPKAKEEYARAYNQVQDKKFSLSRSFHLYQTNIG